MMRRKARVLRLVIGATAGGALGARIEAQQAENPDSVLANEKRVMITPFVAPGYTPEQGALITVGALLSFRTNPGYKHGTLSELVQRSTITLNGSISTTSAITFNADLSSFWKGDRLRIFAKFGYKDMPDHYWGVGIDAGKAPEVDSITGYQRTSWVAMPKVLWRIHRKILIGGVLDFNYTGASEVSPGMEADPYFQEFGPDNHNAGGGVIFQYDTRDIAANAWQGVFFNAQAVFYGSFLGSDNKYQIYDLEYRQYRQMGRPGKTLAWTGRTRLSYGAVPWAELSQLGSSTDLRGYRQGRYRDKAMLYGILEYRHQFLNAKRSSGMSRHGLVGWFGIGSVGNDFTELDQWLPNWGAGYRFEVQPRMSVRVDVGFGREFLQSGNTYVPSVYFSFTEAF